MAAVLHINSPNAGNLAAILQAVGKASGSRALKVAIGAGVKDTWKQHLYAKDRKTNRLGGNRTHYWRQAGESIASNNTARGIALTATQIGIHLKATGGVITPKNAKALTIPIHPAAHGKRAREFDNLVFLKTKKGKPNTMGILARVTGKDDVEPYYVLRTKATIKADPTIFPKQSIVLQTATDAAMDYLRSLQGIN